MTMAFLLNLHGDVKRYVFTRSYVALQFEDDYVVESYPPVLSGISDDIWLRRKTKSFDRLIKATS